MITGRWPAGRIAVLISAVLLFHLLGGVEVAAEGRLVETQTVFSQFSNRVAKIEVVETGSGAKAVVGSGFFVSGDGLVVTNYHVISKLIVHPSRYRAELVEPEGARRTLSVLAVDAINDLALVKADVAGAAYFAIADEDIAQGSRLYSLGFPHDIGLSIVEGTYNGLLRHALYPKIHFTAPINPGMSGGPAITPRGRVAGVNVSSAGEEVSFLVPAAAVRKLLASAGQRRSAGGFLEDVRQQLLSHQDVYFTEQLTRSGDPVRLGPYSLPSKMAPFFKCWGDSENKERLRYKAFEHQCSTDDYVYVSDGHRTGIISVVHRLLTTEEMNRLGFYDLYSAQFGSGYGGHGNEDEVTRYQCTTGTVRKGTLTFRTAFCARAYRKLGGLYDVVFKAAVLGEPRRGLETTLTLAGVTFDKAVTLSRGYLEAITWAE